VHPEGKGSVVNVAVTGIAGFLGSHIASVLVEDHHVRGWDDLSGGDLANVPDDAWFEQRRCQDLREDDFAGIDVVYHCAALAHEGLSVFSPRTITDSIFGASVAVFFAAVQAGVRRIIYCSSMSRYGAGPTPFRETQPPAPQDPYAIAKVASEEVLKCLADVHGFEYIITVPHNIIGTRQKYDDPFRNVAAIMANLMLQGRPPFIYGDGEQVRCFTDVRDILPLYVDMLTDDRHGYVINVGPDEEFVTINQLAFELAEIIGCPHEAIYIADRPQEVKEAVCSSDRAREMFLYTTRYTLRDTLVRLVNWIKAHGTKPFQYHLPLEIVTDKTPSTWAKRRF
jgi:UDP-glucose 4-epimerase